MGDKHANMASSQSVQCFGKKKTATAVAHCKAGKGLVKVNGKPLNLVQPEILRFKVYEPLLIVGLEKFANVDIRVRVTGGGHTSQVYAIRQAISKSIVAYYQKFVDEHSKNAISNSSSHTTVRCWSPITDVASQRSSEVPEPEPDTKSLTVKGWGGLWGLGFGEWFLLHLQRMGSAFFAGCRILSK